jgi:hypothetical protein
MMPVVVPGRGGRCQQRGGGGGKKESSGHGVVSLARATGRRAFVRQNAGAGAALRGFGQDGPGGR